ncbi:cytochrome c1 [Castellaniella sp.]|uniref:cytochrome c1 n=1 Tax=Castellaniella sp. TaxID=1955812 RepID=UPI0035692385
MIKKLLGVLALSLTCTFAYAADGGAQIQKAPDRISDLAALQNGAKMFVNYCLNCHSASAMRYNKLMDLGLTEEDIKKNLLFTRERVGDLMTISMTPEDAKRWFGTIPPDLSVIARAKSTSFGPSGVDYIYTYLSTFFRDAERNTGWNNVIFPNVGMPNVLWELEGPRTLTDVQVHQVPNESGNMHWVKTTSVFDHNGYAEITNETLANYQGDVTRTTTFDSKDAKAFAQFQNDVADLSNFLGWMAEPVQLERREIGVIVMIFLVLFLLIAIRMNNTYWKHVR